MMGYIDLLDDSDDDIPLLPSNTAKGKSPVFASANSVTGGKRSAAKSEPIDLLSSDEDDDAPILKRLKPGSSIASCSGIGSEHPLTADSDSDVTEKYGSCSTERYSFSSELGSLPDLNAADAAPPAGNYIGSTNGSDVETERAITASHATLSKDPTDEVSPHLKRTDKPLVDENLDATKYTSIKVRQWYFVQIVRFINCSKCGCVNRSLCIL